MESPHKLRVGLHTDASIIEISVGNSQKAKRTPTHTPQLCHLMYTQMIQHSSVEILGQQCYCHSIHNT